MSPSGILTPWLSSGCVQSTMGAGEKCWQLVLTQAVEQQRGEVATYLDAGACALLAKAAGQSPAAGWDVRDLGDGLHLFGAADADLGGTWRAVSGFSCSACPKEPKWGLSAETRQEADRAEGESLNSKSFLTVPS